MRLTSPALTERYFLFVLILKHTPPIETLATFPKIDLTIWYDKSWSKEFDVFLATVV